MLGLIDDNGETRKQLATLLEANGHRVSPFNHPDEIAPPLAQQAIILNLHAHTQDGAALCRRVRQRAPTTPLLLLVAPGAPLREAGRWMRDKLADGVQTKPVRLPQLLDALTPLMGQGQALRELGSTLPPSAQHRFIAHDHAATLCERTLLFSDVRGSTQVLERMQADGFFRTLNQLLTAQSEVVTANFGEVIKFTGDGMMAAFAGPNRVHLALRCALALQRMDTEVSVRHGLRVGLGLADGLVMSGFVGNQTRQQYDLIGHTVHLAARLCRHAQAGQIVLPDTDYQRAHLPVAGRIALGEINVKGFDRAVACSAIHSLEEGVSP